MTSFVKEIKIEFKKKNDGTEQGDLDKLEVTLWDRTEPELTDEEGTAIGTEIWKSSNGLEIVQTNPFCINIGGRKICWG